MAKIQIEINLKKWILLSPILTMLICFIYNTVQSKPFKFEAFKSEADGEAFLRKRYIGKHIAEVLCEMDKIGVKCSDKEVYDKSTKYWQRDHLRSYRGYVPDYKKYEDVYSGCYGCHYYNNWISRDPLAYYQFWFFLDDNDKVFGILFKQFEKLVI